MSNPAPGGASGTANAFSQRMRKVLILAILPAIFCVRASPAESNKSPGPATAGAEVIREMNLARQHPEIYVRQLEELRGHFRGNVLVLPGGTLLHTHEGVDSVDDAIRFLQRARPLAPFIYSPGISLAAAEHVADQATGAFGHSGSDHSDPGERMNRHEPGVRSGERTLPMAKRRRAMWSSH